MSFRTLALLGTLSTALLAADGAAAPVTAWMSWEGGVDIAGFTKPGLSQPNLLLHVGRIVHTPVGSAPSGIVIWQPDPGAAPVVMGFVSSDAAVGAYFGPHVFAGTPFEKAPVLPAKITVENSEDRASSRIEVAGHVFTVTLSGLAAAQHVDRAPGAFPFHQQGVESEAGMVAVTVDGQPVAVTVPPADPVRGPSAVFSQTGVYSR
jgi:hypothetical protein